MIDALTVDFTDAHRDLETRAADVAERLIAPIEEAGGTEDELARRYAAELADADLLRYAVPSAGDGPPDRFDLRALCIIRENLARASGSADVAFAMQGLGSAPISLAGSDDQRRRHLPGVARGEVLGAFALTEPDAGSDVQSMTTRAERDGDGYALHGTKTFISNAGVAGLYTVFARTNPEAKKDGISAFIVDGDNPGLIVAERQEVIAPHPIGTLRFDGCRVPAESRLGDEGDGFKIAMRTLDIFRPTVGAAAIGMARRALAVAIERAKERVQFGQPIARQQAIQFYLADMATQIDAARLLVYRTATAIDGGREGTTRASSMAKLFATEAAQQVIDKAVQIFGGAGVLKGSVVERLYREVRALRIYEGTSEIQHLVIARDLLKSPSPGYG